MRVTREHQLKCDKCQLHYYQKDVCCAGPKLYSAVSSNIKIINYDVKVF